MRLRIGKLLIEPPGGFLAQGRVRLNHVKGVHIGAVYVHAGWNPAFFQVLDILHRFGVERLSVPYKGVGRRKAGKVRQSGRSGIGRQAVPLLPPQIPAPGSGVGLREWRFFAPESPGLVSWITWLSPDIITLYHQTGSIIL